MPFNAEITRLRKTLITCRRQFRHHTDNSPSLFNPAQGFVYGYTEEEVDAALQELERAYTELWAGEVKKRGAG